MSDSIVTRIRRMFLGHTHAALDKMDDPIIKGRQLLRELEEKVKQHEGRLIDVLAKFKPMQSKVESLAADIAQYEDQAGQLLDKGDEKLATRLCERIEALDRERLVYQKGIDTLEPKVAKMNQQLDQLREQRDSLARDMDLLDVRHQVAKTIESTAIVLGDSSLNTINFDEIRQRVDAIEARAEAVEEVQGNKPADDELDLALESLGTSPVSARLEAIKRRRAEGV